MSEKIAEIIETLEAADRLFNELQDISEEVRNLWSAGIERFAGAIWLYERGRGESEETGALSAEMPHPAAKGPA